MTPSPSLYTLEDLVEQLAAIEHERWADWQKWVHEVAELHQDANGNDDGVLIPHEMFVQWERQINTPYAELSEAEKQSDRDQVARYLPLLNNKIRKVALEVIGEDENTKAKDPSGLRPWLFDVPAQMRNDLRAQQRTHLDSLLNETKQ